MKKAIMILILIIVLLPLVSCEKETIYWDFEYDYTDIKEIKRRCTDYSKMLSAD